MILPYRNKLFFAMSRCASTRFFLNDCVFLVARVCVPWVGHGDVWVGGGGEFGNRRYSTQFSWTRFWSSDPRDRDNEHEKNENSKHTDVSKYFFSHPVMRGIQLLFAVRWDSANAARLVLYRIGVLRIETHVQNSRRFVLSGGHGCL